MFGVDRRQHCSKQRCFIAIAGSQVGRSHSISVPGITLGCMLFWNKHTSPICQPVYFHKGIRSLQSYNQFKSHLKTTCLLIVIIIVIAIKDIYVAQVRKGHKCAMSAEMAVWLRNYVCLCTYMLTCTVILPPVDCPCFWFRPCAWHCACYKCLCVCW